MMKKYHELGLKVGILDEGVVTHIGEFTEKTSQRIKITKSQRELPIIIYGDVLKEISKDGLSKN